MFSLRRSILAGALLTTLVAGCASVTVTSITPPPATPLAPANPSRAGSAPAASAGLPSFAHVYVIVLENDLYRRAEAAQVDAMFAAARHVGHSRLGVFRWRRSRNIER